LARKRFFSSAFEYLCAPYFSKLKDPLSGHIIEFVGLSEGPHSFVHQIDDAFMQSFPEQDFSRVQLTGRVELTKKADLSMGISMFLGGTIDTLCDRTGRSFTMAVDAERKMIVQFGIDWNTDDDELVVIPREEHSINTAQWFYELLVQSMPLKKLHPDVNEEDVTLFSTASEEVSSIDPRWEKLKTARIQESK
jgi:uncharacterized metal-binding protein YceD (DUF177 family)